MSTDTNKPGLEPSGPEFRKPELRQPELKKAEVKPILQPVAKTAEIPATEKPGNTPTKAAEPKKALKLVLAAAAVGVALAALLGTQLASSSGGSNIGAFVASGDNLAQSDAKARQDKFDAFIKNGGYQVTAPALTKEAALSAITSMTVGLPDIQTQTALHPNEPVVFVDKQAQPALQKQVESGSYKLVQISLFDDMSIDGDIVSISAPGVNVIVPLFAAPTTVSIPVPINGVTNVLVTGLVDGGGGITMALGNPSVAVPVPLEVGQQVNVPIR